LPLQPLGDGSDPEVVLRDCADDHARMGRVLSEFREEALELSSTCATLSRLATFAPRNL
jgi:hypothetical protein